MKIQLGILMTKDEREAAKVVADQRLAESGAELKKQCREVVNMVRENKGKTFIVLSVLGLVLLIIGSVVYSSFAYSSPECVSMARALRDISASNTVVVADGVVEEFLRECGGK